MVNMRLAKQRGLTTSEVELLNLAHEKMQTAIDNAPVAGYSNDVYLLIEALENMCQHVWGFDLDPTRHTWKKRYWMCATWGGRKFRCGITGEEFTIPAEVEERDYFAFGKSAVDVGRAGGSCRWIGAPIDIN